jgi:hypothetical protein
MHLVFGFAEPNKDAGAYGENITATDLKGI